MQETWLRLNSVKQCLNKCVICVIKLTNSLVNPQERAGVKMILIQDGSQPPNIDKPLRIIGDPYKVQVLLKKHYKRCWVFIPLCYKVIM